MMEILGMQELLVAYELGTYYVIPHFDYERMEDGTIFDMEGEYLEGIFHSNKLEEVLDYLNYFDDIKNELDIHLWYFNENNYCNDEIIIEVNLKQLISLLKEVGIEKLVYNS